MTPRVRLHVILLAGGSGTRFWPASRRKRPKPFLEWDGGRSLLRTTWDRARALAPAERIWVVSHASLARAVRRELPELATGRAIFEPSPKDTAPAIALACATVIRHDPDAIVVILPTDHVVRDTAAFRRAIEAAHRAARTGALVCLGVVPDRPATGFGYLETAVKLRAGVASPIRRFVEKPTAALARRFVRSGRYLWNAGIFVGRASRFLDELSRVAPRLTDAAQAAARGARVRAAWEAVPAVSIDRLVMEKAAGVHAVPLDAGWDDLGTWDSAARHARLPDSSRGKPLLLRSPGSVVFGDGRMVAVVDVPGIVVVDTPDALLVVSRQASESMRDCVRAVAAMGRGDVL